MLMVKKVINFIFEFRPLAQIITIHVVICYFKRQTVCKHVQVMEINLIAWQVFSLNFLSKMAISLQFTI